LKCWQTDASFTSFYTSILADAPFAAYRWETPPITTATVGRDFEFVLIDAPGLDRAADPLAFADQLRAAGIASSILTFANLGKDAILVVPRPAGQSPAFAHMAAFIRTAPEAQKHGLWCAIGAAMQSRLSKSPVWLSTAGMGVPWLHVRLDARPKYYGFEPYTMMR